MRIGAFAGAAQLRHEVAEVRVVTEQHRPLGIAGVGQDGIERRQIERPGQAIVLRDGDPEMTGDDLRGLGRPQLGRGDRPRPP